ncbi:MAG TPA: FAD-dependent monooxygenase, partial [Polyangia bacterium]|nr:FAD-dependent monooxygenase [Polyangia bacterium]
MRQDSTSVLVVGGSLVGLSTALFLSANGVPTVLVERHAGSSPHPRAIGYTTRTLELLRAVGLGGRIPEVPAGFRLRRVRIESLAGRWFDEAAAWTPDKRADERADVKADKRADLKAEERADVKADERAGEKADKRADVKADERADVKANLKADEKAH